MGTDDEELMRLHEAATETAKWERLTHHMLRTRQITVMLEKHIEAFDQKLEKGLELLQQQATRQALLDKEIATTMKAVEACAMQHKPMEQRVRDLELSQPMHKQTAIWVEKALWAMACAAAVFIGFKAGLIH